MSGDGSSATAAPSLLPIADDQCLIRRGPAMMLAAEPGIKVVARARDGLQAIELAICAVGSRT
jgi:hypothetical protein